MSPAPAAAAARSLTPRPVTAPALNKKPKTKLHQHDRRHLAHLLHRRRPRRPALPRLPHRGARDRGGLLLGGGLSGAVRRPADEVGRCEPPPSGALFLREKSPRAEPHARPRPIPTIPPPPPHPRAQNPQKIRPPPPPKKPQNKTKKRYHSPRLASFADAVARHSAVPECVEQSIAALPHDTHPMACLLVGLTALSGCHPERRPRRRRSSPRAHGQKNSTPKSPNPRKTHKPKTNRTSTAPERCRTSRSPASSARCPP
jgi:hypothetical protein